MVGLMAVTKPSSRKPTASGSSTRTGGKSGYSSSLAVAGALMLWAVVGCAYMSTTGARTIPPLTAPVRHPESEQGMSA